MYDFMYSTQYIDLQYQGHYIQNSPFLSLSLSTLDSVFPNQRKAGTAGAQEQTKRICSSDASSSDFRFFDDHVKDKGNSTPFADNKLKMKYRPFNVGCPASG